MPRPFKTHCACGRYRRHGPHFFVDHTNGHPRLPCKACAASQALAWRTANPEKHRVIFRRVNHKINIRKRFDMSEEEFDALYSKCDGLCEVCRRPEPRKRRLSLDHNHKTKKRRGFTCCRCNLLIGLAEDNPELLEQAAAYLRRYDGERKAA